ncbi:Uncharacterised protein [Mycobacteroides abscessus subsp. abscessus]|uniref:XRE family transcriptional regulator n=2 Tax=Mycobacteroides abscessus TaxID=36809 RepID=UPI000925F298|nr:XRE family transcriptional regulator [Mycobacteroides abscessus]QSM05126.1 hypothetical protein PROPHIGD102-1_26 [Mycobacterium phage prophiGD102-1]SHW30463.1 Uncharacterised protein [Mycobacteroides abscessus subsp. abscessus]SIA44963.1 Uncharacterised protein [Mycobacteroides abscessus subsp. abscessus]SID24759.1 Uncharacterised protein [Mycobacteroides abscessus subsp. abscessus]SID47259.1 Uncharacterised protein [Mycobacteroides abscessus subsp. abscessus]
MSKLEPTEAQRKAMAEATEAWNWYSCGPERRLDTVDKMIAAANSIADGAPVGTIARRPDGEWIAWRTEDGWGYRFIGDEEPNEWPPGSSIADFWPQIRPDEWPDQSGLDWFPPGEEPIVPRPDPTAQQEPPKGLYGKYRVERVDGKPIRACFVLEYLDDLHANKALLEYAFSVERVNPELAKDLRAEWGKWPGRSQQEPGESLARGLDDLAAGRVSRRDDYLEPQPEPKLCSGCCQCQAPKPPRTPRVVDRLGVDERGAEWKRRGISRVSYIWEYRFRNGVWQVRLVGNEAWASMSPGTEPTNGPYTEVLGDPS